MCFGLSLAPPMILSVGVCVCVCIKSPGAGRHNGYLCAVNVMLWCDFSTSLQGDSLSDKECLRPGATR
jgi:hypothetical protein